MSKQFLDSLYKAANDQKLSKQTVDQALEFSRKMCGHVLRQYLALIAEGMGDNELYKLIMDTFPGCDTVGAQKINFVEHKLTLVLKFAIVDKDTVITIQTEKSYIKEILNNMDRLVNLMQSYFRTTMQLNEVLRHKLCKALNIKPEHEANIELAVNKHNRNMFFVNELEKQIGIVLYYEDVNGNVVTEITEEALLGLPPRAAPAGPAAITPGNTPGQPGLRSSEEAPRIEEID